MRQSPFEKRPANELATSSGLHLHSSVEKKSPSFASKLVLGFFFQILLQTGVSPISAGCTVLWNGWGGRRLDLDTFPVEGRTSGAWAVVSSTWWHRSLAPGMARKCSPQGNVKKCALSHKGSTHVPGWGGMGPSLFLCQYFLCSWPNTTVWSLSHSLCSQPFFFLLSSSKEMFFDFREKQQLIAFCLYAPQLGIEPATTECALTWNQLATFWCTGWSSN